MINGTLLYIDCGAGYMIMYLSKLNYTMKSEFYVNLNFLKKHKGREGSFLLSAVLDVTSESRAAILSL